MAREVGVSMTIQDLRDVLNYIENNHSFRKAQGKMVKYVSPTIDMRMGDIFHVNLRRSEEGIDFAIVNENKDKNLKQWIMEWLDKGSWDSNEI